jgi:hypothetical protein
MIEEESLEQYLEAAYPTYVVLSRAEEGVVRADPHPDRHLA